MNRHVIEKVTKTMYVCDTRRFYKDLRIVGASQYGPFRGECHNPEIEMQMRIQVALTEIKRISITPKTIDAAEAFIRSAKGA